MTSTPNVHPSSHTRRPGTRSAPQAAPIGVRADQLRRRLGVLDRLNEAGRLPVEALDRLTRLATAITGAPVGLAVLVDDVRQVFVSQVGLGEPWASLGESPLSHSLCQHVAATSSPLVVGDAREVDWLKENLGVRDLDVVAYAGMPLMAGGECVGSFCLVDSVPRTWSARDLSALADLSGAAADELALHLAVAQQAETLQELGDTSDFLQLITQTMPGGLLVIDSEGAVSYANDRAIALLDWSSGNAASRTLADFSPASDADGSGQGESPILRARVSDRPVRVADDEFLRGDGTLLPVAYSAAPTKLPNGTTGVIVVFGDNTRQRAEAERLRRESETLHQIARIKEALAEERFVLYAQPIVDLATHRTIQHELLIRMVDADGSIVPPLEFLPIAEEYGLIKEIDRYVIERAMRLAAQGHAVELNISAHSLSDDQLGTFVEERLGHYGVDPSLLVFEITETALVANEETANQFVTLINSLGCTVALDDFGTGYGSFHYLKHLPVQMLKIDREFVRDLHSDEASKLVIKAVISLAQGLGKITVAEGIEDAETLETLRSLGVDHAQGYFLGRPAPADGVFGMPA